MKKPPQKDKSNLQLIGGMLDSFQCQTRSRLQSLNSKHQQLERKANYLSASRNPAVNEPAAMSFFSLGWATQHLAIATRFVTMVQETPATAWVQPDQKLSPGAAADEIRNLKLMAEVAADSLDLAQICIDKADGRLKKAASEMRASCPTAACQEPVRSRRPAPLTRTDISL